MKCTAIHQEQQLVLLVELLSYSSIDTVVISLLNNGLLKFGVLKHYYFQESLILRFVPYTYYIIMFSTKIVKIIVLQVTIQYF